MKQRIIAHRGHKTEAPEQTIAAYRMAVELGAEMIEADVQISRDGVAVMMHDETLERTTNRHGPVSALDWAEICTLDAGSWFDPRFAGERVPRLDDLFALAQEAGIALCLEAKGQTMSELVHLADPRPAASKAAIHEVNLFSAHPLFLLLLTSGA